MDALTVHSTTRRTPVNEDSTTLRRERDAAARAQAAYNRSEAFRERSYGHAQNVLALLHRADRGEVA